MTNDELRPKGASAMEGHGAYNRNSAVQEGGAASALPLIEHAARAARLPPHPEPIVIADYGSSQGRNSFGPIAAATHVLRGRTDPDQPISVVHTDLPGNDFTSLFLALATDEQSYLKRDPGTFPSAIGRSFYEQILPTGTVTLGWCSWAVQWLSRTPAPIPDQVQVAYSADARVRELYSRQSADDWRTFLSHRSRELRPGGYLVILTMALTADGDFGYRPLLKAMYGALEGLVEDGFMKREELHRMAIPTVGRSLADIRAPFVNRTFADLHLEHASVFVDRDKIWDDFQQDADTQAFGARWAAFSRASVLPTLALDLDGGAGDPRIPRFLDRIEAAMAVRLAASPEELVIPLALVVVKKT